MAEDNLSPEDQNKNNEVDLSTGEALSLGASNFISASDKTKLVVLVGPPNTGKTTILMSLYDSFHLGPINNYAFSGSETLMGFEKRLANYRNINSEDQPETSRTTRRAQEVLHLRISDKQLGTKRSLLLADISGEDFSEGASSTEDANALSFLKAADIVALMVDSAELKNVASVETHVRKLSILIRRLIEGGRLSKKTVFHVVFSKKDCLPNSIETQSTKDSIQLAQRHLLSNLESNGFLVLKDLFFVQAVPRMNRSGFEQLVHLWMKSEETKLYNGDPKIQKSSRKFDMFGMVSRGDA